MRGYGGGRILDEVHGADRTRKPARPPGLAPRSPASHRQSQPCPRNQRLRQQHGAIDADRRSASQREPQSLARFTPVAAVVSGALRCAPSLDSARSEEKQVMKIMTDQSYHSRRNATSGSTFVARRAGIQQASSATAASNNE